MKTLGKWESVSLFPWRECVPVFLPRLFAFVGIDKDSPILKSIQYHSDISWACRILKNTSLTVWYLGQLTRQFSESLSSLDECYCSVSRAVKSLGLQIQ